MPVIIAKIAVAAATFWIDRPYDYLVPEEFAAKIQPGMRVTVPFSRGNRQTEGIVLALSNASKYDSPKPVTALLDHAPVLTEEQLRCLSSGFVAGMGHPDATCGSLVGACNRICCYGIW